MLVLKRHYEYWFAAVALHKLGAVMIPGNTYADGKRFCLSYSSLKSKSHRLVPRKMRCLKKYRAALKQIRDRSAKLLVVFRRTWTAL